VRLPYKPIRELVKTGAQILFSIVADDRSVNLADRDWCFPRLHLKSRAGGGTASEIGGKLST